MVPSAWRWLLTVAAVLVQVSAPFAQQGRVSESSVKAAFVIRFLEFVHWPAAARSSSNPLSVCLSSSHPFGASVSSFADPPTGRVRFEVCLGQANRAGLKIDSQLLNLATKVHGGHP